jgi:formylglycine-generating enzyme required for sulfatase activity
MVHHEPVAPDLILIPGGLFVMGSEDGQDDERPPHEVELSPYYMSRYAVTNREYAVFVEAMSVPPSARRDDSRFNHADQPVVAVNWFEASAYCEWLGSRLGLPYRLPTEAEREMACRAGTNSNYPWGDSPNFEASDYGRRWLEGGPELVGGPPNEFGLCNMADNVHEWCTDWYSAGYYGVSPRRNPQGPAAGVRRVSRGGSWRHQLKVTRSSARSSLMPASRYTDYGFRVSSDE